MHRRVTGSQTSCFGKPKGMLLADGLSIRRRLPLLSLIRQGPAPPGRKSREKRRGSTVRGDAGKNTGPPTPLQRIERGEGWPVEGAEAAEEGGVGDGAAPPPAPDRGADERDVRGHPLE